ncbi:SWIM zinc finger family protein [Egicoccus halophilus]|uniref:SWIM-type domain-containing protein n=1 Tax=Egicoccus halophilus TaxID=1670830 RepID=A0A8J3AIF3_9ACTN|nr:hypothetical protein [Egicoccus halophilus]GGI09733.1 hypothetical protein GCM10011354_35540 [Egicoccus halophilus]
MSGTVPGSGTDPSAPDGRHWWGQRWREVLDASGAANARRVQRGQGLARRGAVSDVRIEPGEVHGTVREDRGAPCDVVLAWSLPEPGAWDRAMSALAAELRFTAALLDGQLPQGVAAVLEAAGVPVLPRFTDLAIRCSCEADRQLCRHAAAVHTVAAAAIDRDPFLLLRLRGRDRERLLRELRSRRGGSEQVADDGLDLSRGMFAAGGDLDAIPLQPTPVEDPSALFQRLGPPPGVEDIEPYLRAIERAAEGAWRLAAGEGSDAADEELLLSELRAQRIGSAPSLAAALGRDVEAIRDQLDRLFDAGTVLRTGTGDRARYRATS